ncbi:4Fe-4S double cluster binding domain-containing protein [Gorillibacterium timonense]|uniref:4Fe-4S double cluster binding domain-containing protein n=1 Tax=Gorillibacterium timonense TaxID=1689269 RepID=UPI00071D4047|nr:4Fe-4S double cluster binding domain-containing protein [Gorillibacterium timonense]
MIEELIDSAVGGEDTLWGAADLSYSEFYDRYSTAIVVAQAYDRYVPEDPYDEQGYHEVMSRFRDTIDQKIARLAQMLEQAGIEHYVPPVAQRDEQSLIAPFSFKHGAVLAGLGWIGKNSLLITRKFGPRVRLGAVLIRDSMECGEPIVKSGCRNCRACVDACPWGMIKGINWTPTTRRDELLDYQRCNAKRREYIESHGRKHTCGYCLLACPWGKKRK